MNRKKLARRTALARKINQKWVLIRAVERMFVESLAAFYVTPRRLELLTANNMFEGGRVIADNFSFEVA